LVSPVVPIDEMQRLVDDGSVSEVALVARQLIPAELVRWLSGTSQRVRSRYMVAAPPVEMTRC